MLQIAKGAEPPKLREWRLTTPDACFGALPVDVKREVKEYLLRDQCHLCAYCGRRIGLGTMRVEHWVAQSKDDDEAVSWPNLLGACDGGESVWEPARLHCDVSRGNRVLVLNPADPKHDCAHVVKYRLSGEVYSDDADVDRMLNEVLNLNNGDRLRENRRRLLHAWAKKLRAGPRGGRKSRIQRAYDKLVQQRARKEELPEYAPILFHWAAERLDRG